MKQICVVGVGYVGLVTAACFSDLGNRVIALDIMEEKIEGLRRFELPIYEPGLKELVERNVKAGRLSFTTSYPEALQGTEFAFIAVGTPSGVDGEADLRYVAAAAPLDRRAACGTLDRHQQIDRAGGHRRLGGGHHPQAPDASRSPSRWSPARSFCGKARPSATSCSPHRTVLGSLDREAAEKVAQLHLPLRAPIVITDLRTAEMIKYASNAFLATKISFINEIANICEALGADVKEVATGMGYDKRIGPAFLDAGLGLWRLLLPQGREGAGLHGGGEGPPPAAAARGDGDQRRPPPDVREQAERDAGRAEGQDDWAAGAVLQAEHRRHARCAVDRRSARSCWRRGRRCGPTTRWRWRSPSGLMPGVEMCPDPYTWREGCDALMVVTEWNEFKQLDLGQIRDGMRQPVLLDGRNIYDPAAMKELGFRYRGVGRGYNGSLLNQFIEPSENEKVILAVTV